MPLRRGWGGRRSKFCDPDGKSAGWRLWDANLIDRANAAAQKKPFYKSPALRLSLSLSTILLLYRLLFRFLTRLRVHLLDPQVEPFRLRNPRTAATLTSPYAPALGASLAGLALGIYPSQKMRVTVAIYTIFRALEFGYNVCEADGLIWGVKNGRKRDRPWWFGSWLLQPLAMGQLFHSFVFDRDCFPKVCRRLMRENVWERKYLTCRSRMEILF